MDRLNQLLGAEHQFSHVCGELRGAIRALAPAGVGAMEITCADESEYECAEAFQRTFAQEMLPRLKYGSHVPFRIANPGGRYEWGSAAIAEQHFATPASKNAFKVMVVKINGHVAVTRSGEGGLEFGHMDRYGAASTYCGAIHALLDGADLPFVDDLKASFLSEGVDRLAILRDDAQVAPNERVLFGAAANARLQARHAVQDIQEHEPTTPTLYLVLHAVTLNRPGLDTELVGGLYVLDHRNARRKETYRGIGDDPSKYELTEHLSQLRLRDENLQTVRAVRSHRVLAARRLALIRKDAPSADGPVGQALRAAQQAGRGGAARVALRALLFAVAEVTPLTAALYLFSEGLAGVHHVRRVHRGGSLADQEQAAREVLEAVQRSLDKLPAGKVEQVLERLRKNYAHTDASAPSA